MNTVYLIIGLSYILKHFYFGLKIRGILLNDLYRICNWSVIQIKFLSQLFVCIFILIIVYPLKLA